MLTLFNLDAGSPLLIFGRAALLGVAARGDVSACRNAYPTCPRDPDHLVHYLNNHHGGFFRFFNGLPKARITSGGLLLPDRTGTGQLRLDDEDLGGYDGTFKFPGHASSQQDNRKGKTLKFPQAEEERIVGNGEFNYRDGPENSIRPYLSEQGNRKGKSLKFPQGEENRIIGNGEYNYREEPENSVHQFFSEQGKRKGKKLIFPQGEDDRVSSKAETYYRDQRQTYDTNHQGANKPLRFPSERMDTDSQSVVQT